MSADIDHIVATIADLKAKRDKLNITIEGLEEYLAMIGIGAVATQRVAGAGDIAPDAFLSLTLGDAAFKYLGMVRKIQTVAQIADALKKGGLHHAKNNAVHTALTRREQKTGDVIKADANNWGLAEWYATNPNVKRRQKANKPQENQSTTPRTEQGRTDRSVLNASIRIVDACEEILRKAGHRLHATDLIERLVADYGKFTNVKSLAGTLPQDGKKRFQNMGRNFWVLRDWPDEMKRQGQKENTQPL